MQVTETIFNNSKNSTSINKMNTMNIL